MAKDWVLVTGSSVGIGAAVVRMLAQAGFQVLAGVRKPADADTLRALSHNIQPVQLDVTRNSDIEAVAEHIRTQIPAGRFAGVVNNAGIAVAGPLEFLPDDEFRRQFEVNVFGLMSITRAVLPFLRASRGRVVLVGSISGRFVAPFTGAYSASKFAVDAISQALRQELVPAGIAVSLIEPGAIKTEIWDRSTQLANDLEARMSPEARALYAREFKAVRARVADTVRTAIPPEKVAEAVLHALTATRPRNRYVVGKDARFRAGLTHLLPESFREPLVRKLMKLDG